MFKGNDRLPEAPADSTSLQTAVVFQLDALLSLGNGWLVAGFGDLVACHGIDKSGLADIGNAGNHRQNLVVAIGLGWNQFAAEMK